MSITPQALERSVLERKERDELAAIAEAMGVKPSSRASKATLIDQILREAGIVDSEKHGLWSFYYVRPGALEELSRWLAP